MMLESISCYATRAREMSPAVEVPDSQKPLVTCSLTTNMAIENGPFIVDLPINSMVDLSIVFCTFTRGYTNLLWKMMFQLPDIAG